MKRRITALTILLTLVLTGFFAPRETAAKVNATQATMPLIVKSTMHVRTWRMVRYWKSPDTDNYWSWMPGLEFQVYGEIPDSSFYTIDYMMPDGKLWYSADVTPNAIKGNLLTRIESPQASGHMDKRGILDIGTFGFKIRYRNGLSGVDQEIFKGRFKVNKFHVGNNLPAFKNQFEYYVDNDWNLPVGYLWLDYISNKDAPPLKAAMWFRGENDDTKLSAYVFYNGKQIASTKTSTGVAGSDKSILTSGNDADPRWERWVFTFNDVRGYNTDTSGNRYTAHFLYSNPGNYEIKVLNDGDLVRTASFTVGQDGKIVDNGIATQNKINTYYMILPVKVAGTKDGKWDMNAWKTDAFYGNPLAGFTAP